MNVMSVDEAWADYRGKVVAAFDPLDPQLEDVLRSTFYAGFARALGVRDKRVIRQSLDQLLRQAQEL